METLRYYTNHFFTPIPFYMKHSFFFKNCSLLAFLLFSVFINYAQSITGTWKLVDAKEIVTDKASGQEQDISGQMKEFLSMVHSEITFNNDGTYSSLNTMGNSKKGLATNGTYKVSGNQLVLKSTGSNMPQTPQQSPNQLPPNVTIQSVSATSLVLHYTSEGLHEKNFRVAITNTYQKQ